MNGGGNGPFNGLAATLTNPLRISGGYSFVYRETDGFTGTVKLFGTFQLGANQLPVGGVVTGFTFVTSNGTSVYSGFSLATATVVSYLRQNTNEVFFPSVFSGADRFTGSGFNDHISGYAGNDTILGANGNDWLYGGRGNDLLNGGSGVDGASYYSATAGVKVSLQIQNLAQNTGIDGTDTLVSIEKLEGSDFGDSLSGSVGADTLWGLDGNDTLLGGNGNDWLHGGKGTDRLYGGAGIDGVSYYDADGAVRVSLYLQGQSQNTFAEGLDTLVDIEKLEGSQFGDTLTGSDGANSFWGLGGNDILSGGSGDDVLLGGEGTDRLYGGAGIDTASYYYADGGVVVSLNLQNRSQNTGSEGYDFLTGFEHLEGSDYGDTLTGSGTNNRIWGELGNDIINGLGGDDEIIGGVGSDILRGGTGQDDFIYYQGWTDGADRIFDFNTIGDQIGFQNSIFSSYASVMAATSDTTSGARIAWSGGSVLLVGVDKIELSQNDFYFFA